MFSKFSWVWFIFLFLTFMTNAKRIFSIEVLFEISLVRGDFLTELGNFVSGGTHKLPDIPNKLPIIPYNLPTSIALTPKYLYKLPSLPSRTPKYCINSETLSLSKVLIVKIKYTVSIIKWYKKILIFLCLLRVKWYQGWAKC